MRSANTTKVALVPLPITLMETLLELNSLLDDQVVKVFVSKIGKTRAAGEVIQKPSTRDVGATRGGKYKLEFIGESLPAESLWAVFCIAINMMAEIAPEALDVLASRRTRSRRYIARNSADIHPSSPHLQTVKTRSG